MCEAVRKLAFYNYNLKTKEKDLMERNFYLLVILMEKHVYRAEM